MMPADSCMKNWVIILFNEKKGRWYPAIMPKHGIVKTFNNPHVAVSEGMESFPKRNFRIVNLKYIRNSYILDQHIVSEFSTSKTEGSI